MLTDIKMKKKNNVELGQSDLFPETTEPMVLKFHMQHD